MANGQFPVTYDVAAEGTRVAHDEIDALIALDEFKTSRGQPFYEKMGTRDFIVGEDVDINNIMKSLNVLQHPGQKGSSFDPKGFMQTLWPTKDLFTTKQHPGLKQIVKDRSSETYKRGTQGVPIHMPSYATLFEMALDAPWVDERMPDEQRPSELIRKSKHLGVSDWEDKQKAMEMLTSGKDILEKMRMGDVPGGAVSYHFPKMVKRKYSGVAERGEDKLLPEGTAMAAFLQMPQPLASGFQYNENRQAYTETPDTTKSFFGSAGPYKYGYEDIPDGGQKVIGVYPHDDPIKSALNTLRTLMHEPFHFPIARKGLSKPMADTYGFVHPEQEGDYSQLLYDAVENLLQESLLKKYSKKDLADITNRLTKGEEIDFGKYKRLDIGGK